MRTAGDAVFDRKDSATMLHLARKAFHPAPPPFPLLHVDTSWKFRDMYALSATG
jgi:sulfate adenylyltransferase subunit 2